MENRLGWQGLGMGQVEENWYDYKGKQKGILHNSGSKLWGNYEATHMIKLNKYKIHVHK